MHQRPKTPLALLPLTRSLALAGLALSFGARAEEARPATDVVTPEPADLQQAPRSWQLSAKAEF